MAKSSNKKRKTHKKNMLVMVGCSNSKTCRHKHKHKNKKSLGKHVCSNCGPNCGCGKNCKCPSPCPGDCNKSSIFGGSGCGSSGCPIAPLSMNGGTNFYKSGPPVPGPFVGNSWGTNIKNWPGVDGIGGNRNYLEFNNKTYNDPSYHQSLNDTGYKRMSSLVGGYKYKKPLKKGGGLVPQDLVNLGRDVSFNFKSAYNALNGYPAPVDPVPYKGQLTEQLNNKIFI